MQVKQNSDKKFVKEVREQLKANDWYCPCRVIRTPDTKCMCRDFREMIEREEKGYCYCGLYVIDQIKSG